MFRHYQDLNPGPRGTKSANVPTRSIKVKTFFYLFSRGLTPARRPPPPTPTRTFNRQMTTDSSSSSSTNTDNNPANEEVSVYCRIRPPTNDNDETCIRVVDDKTVQLTPPESSRAFYSWGFNEKEVQYTFKKVFDVSSTQKQIFDQVRV